MTSTRGKAPDNNSSTDSTSFVRSLTTRTSLITTIAVAGVILAGGAAIAANIGILSAADDSEIGELAATELVAVPAVADKTSKTSTTSTTSTTTPGVGVTSDYVVDDAGTVSLLASDDGLALGAAKASDGWTPALSQSEPTSLTVVFTNGARTVVFTAALRDGRIVADVTEPIVVTGATPNGPIMIPTVPSLDDSDDRSFDDDDSYDTDDSYDDDDSYEDDSYEDDSYDDEDDEEEHEYEGADDDD